MQFWSFCNEIPDQFSLVSDAVAFSLISVLDRQSQIEYELVAGYAKDAGYPISTFVRKQALSEKVIILVNISPQNPFTENF